MALVTGSIKREPLDVVWCDDPDVKPPDHLVGAAWLDAALAERSKGADVVTIRALDDDAKTGYDDRSDRPGTALRYALAAGVRALNGSTKGLAEWRKALVLQQPVAAYWLSLRILSETAGKDPAVYYAAARAARGLDPEEVAADAGASKSADGG